MTTVNNTYKLYWDFFTLHFLFKSPVFGIVSFEEPIYMDDLKELNIDQNRLFELMDEYERNYDSYLQYIRTRYEKEQETSPIPEAVKALHKFVKECQEKISDEINQLPNNFEKAEAAIKAYTYTSKFQFDENIVYKGFYLVDEVTPKIKARIFSAWKRDIEYKRKEQHRYSGEEFSYQRDFFWWVRTGLEDRALFSRYLVNSLLKIDVFPAVYNSIEEYIEESLLHLMTDSPIEYIGERWTHGLVEFLYLISKDELLSIKFEQLIQISVKRLKKGIVPNSVNGDNNSISTKCLAYTAIIFSKFARYEEDYDFIERIVQLLLDSQLPDGSWGENKRSHLYTTNLVVEAIIRSGLQSSDSVLDIAFKWILEQQHPNGTWENPEFFFMHFPEFTVDVLLLKRLYDNREKFRNKPNITNADAESSKFLQDTRNLTNGLLSMLHNQGKNFEKLPSSYEGKGEEDIRDLFIISLKGHFDNFIGGEIYNKFGKTDILISSSDGSSNILIAECKFWTGIKGFESALNQLYGYLTWRDRNAALIIFVDRKDIKAVIEKITGYMPSNSKFRRLEEQMSLGWFKYEFLFNEQDSLVISLDVMVFHLADKITEY